MKQFLYCLALMVCCAHTVSGQLTPLGTFYRTQWQWANPAAIDRVLMSYRSQHPDLQLTVNARPQWQITGVDGAPITGFISFENAPRGGAYKKYPIRWGFSIMGDKTDVVGNYGAYGNYSYEFRFDNSRGGPVRKLRLGISGGVVARQYQNWRPLNPTDPLLVQPSNKTYIDAAVGAFYQRFGKFGNVTYWGISLPNMFGLDMSKNREQLLLKDKFTQAYFVWGKYISSRRREYDDGGIEWEPTVWVRGVPRSHYQYYNWFKNGAPPVSVDVTLRAYMGTSNHAPAKIWMGGGIGTNRMLTLEGGVNLPKMGRGSEVESNVQIGLAYSVPFGRNLIQLGHTFELNVAWSFMRDRTSDR
jgi:hypothetical protein